MGVTTVAPQRLILRVLQQAGQTLNREITRMELVKLVYLVDYFYAQHTEGQTLSGLGYIWDNHGPNAVGNAIVKRADWMELTEGTIHIHETMNQMGNSKFLYRAEEDVPVQPIPDELAEALIREVVRAYGPLGWSRLTSFAKKTRPMRGISQGDPLDLTPTQRTNLVLRTIAARFAQGEYDTPGPRASLAELRERSEQRAS